MKSGASTLQPKDEPGYAQSLAWMRAVAFGSTIARRTPEHVDKGTRDAARRPAGHDRRLPGGTVARPSLPADVPVATFGTMRKTLNIGFGRMLPTQLVTAVTVRTSHRRRGLLRRMMAEDLRLAKGDGLAMAALTASEGSIYGRFGFGVASFERPSRWTPPPVSS